MAFGVDDAIGIGSMLVNAFSKKKKAKIPEYKPVAAPNLKMMDATMVSDQKEQALDTTRKELKTQTNKILTGANKAQGLRVGSTFKNIFDVNAAASANLAGKMIDIDNQALNFNNSVLQWTANFNAQQAAWKAQRDWKNAEIQQYNYDQDYAATGKFFGGLTNMAFAIDDSGKRLNYFGSIFDKKNNSYQEFETPKETIK